MGAALSAQAQTADLAVSKTGPATASADTDIAYSVSVFNVGPDDAVNVVLDDPIPFNTTFVSALKTDDPTFSCSVTTSIDCAIGTLPSGSTTTFQFTFHIAPGTAPGTFITNIASVSTSTFDPNDENNSATADTLIPAPSADIYVQKLGPAAAAPGTDIVYSLTVGNGGPSDAANVVLTDALPGTLTFVSLMGNSGPFYTCTIPPLGSNGTVTCTIPTLAAGDSAQITIVAHVPPGTVSGTTFTNFASASSSTDDPDTDNNNASAVTTISSVDVSLNKTGPATVKAGQNLVYTITLSNAGPDFAQTVQFVDTLPPHTSFVSLTQVNGPASVCGHGSATTAGCAITNGLPSGASAQYTLTLHVDTDTPNGTVLTNAATASTTSYDTNASNNNTSFSTTVQNTADIGVVKSGPATVVAGTNATYTMTISNTGPDVANSATLTDTLPANVTFVSLTQTAGPTFGCTSPVVGAGGTVTCLNAALAAGASASFTLVVAISTNAADGSTLTNTASVTTTTPDSNSLNDSSPATATVVNKADLVMSKAGPTNVTAGQNITYTLSLTNAGASPALAAQWSDALPPGTTLVSFAQTGGPVFACTFPTPGSGGTVICTSASLAPGASGQFTLVVAVPGSTANGTVITNVANATTTSVDANPNDNLSSVSTTVSATADLVVSKSVTASGDFGADIVYALSVSNSGPSAAATVNLADPLPGGTHFVSLTQSSGPAFACVTPAVGASGTVNCSIASLPAAASATFVLTIDTTGVTSGAVANTANATTTTFDLNTLNNTATASASLGTPVPAPMLRWPTLLLLIGLLIACAAPAGRRAKART